MHAFSCMRSFLILYPSSIHYKANFFPTPRLSNKWWYILENNELRNPIEFHSIGGFLISRVVMPT